MRAASKKIPKPRRRARNGVRTRDADDVKTQRAGSLGEPGLERSAGQKSRSV
jgi:hypothetical protein